MHKLEGHTVCSRLPGIYCLWLTPSVVNVVTLHSAVRLKYHRARAESLLGSGLLFSLRLLVLIGEWSSWARWLLLYRRWLSTGILVSTLLVLSPKPLNPGSSQVSLSHFAPTFAGVQHLSLLSSCLLWVISSQFSCNSRFVLGGV